MKKGFTIIEVIIVFLLILGVMFFILPKSLETTKQAAFISEWNDNYHDLEYTCAVIRAQKDSEIKKKFKAASNNEDREKIVLETIKPYLRIRSALDDSNYKTKYMNGNPVNIENLYHFDNYYKTESNGIMGLKWFVPMCMKGVICGTLSYDVNGITPPNKWGYDIFGVNVLIDSVEPLGKGLDEDVLKSDCSKKGTGVYCSYYYLIGGKFD